MILDVTVRYVIGAPKASAPSTGLADDGEPLGLLMRFCLTESPRRLFHWHADSVQYASSPLVE